MTLHRCLLATALLALATVTGCASPSASPPTATTAPPGTPIPLQRIDIAPGGRVRIPVPETNRPPEDNPKVQLQLVFIDAVTEEPVTAGRVLIDGEVVAEDTTKARVVLPGRILEQPMILDVRAPGYKRWSLHFRWRLETSRRFLAPIPLEPRGPSA